ncbi:PAS domain S-box protein [Candidatus Woesearchaeota archaeon]|nr:PAS domain S-box protein [Candidatus Woesearchaeota archaeon]
MAKKNYNKLNTTLVQNLKKKIKELRISEEKYRKVINNLSDIIFSYDPYTLKINFITPNVHSFLGYKPEEVLGHKIDEFIHPDDREKVLSELKDSLKTREETPTEIRLLKKDNTHMWIEERGKIAKKEGKIEGMSGVIRNITEKKKSEKKLRESEQKYRALFDKANDAIFIADPSTGKIIDANEQAAKLLGLPLKKIIGMHQTRLHPPDKANLYAKKFRDHIQKGHAADFEAEVITKNKKRIPVYISASVIKIGGRDIIQGIFRDISDLKK